MGLVLKTIYGAILVGVVAVVIGGKFPEVGKHFIVSDPAGQHVGDLYRLCEVDRFRETIRGVASTPTASLAQAEIITLGDSFFNSSLESDLFANELARKGRQAVHNLTSSDFFEPHSYPLAFLKASGYKPDRRRILILESVERSSLERPRSYLATAGASTNRLNALAFKVLKNNDVEYFFKNNLIMHPFIKWLKNVRFDWFGVIDRAVGAYTLKPDMLFYQRDMEFAAAPKPDAVLDEAANRVARLAEILKRQYDLELLYVIIPDKFSVYRDYLPHAGSYDRYIPRLVERLKRRGVHAVDLYSAYLEKRQNSREQLYFVSDTHYTAFGKAVLVDECLREIAAMGGGSKRPIARDTQGQ
jgi:hypothetical protein